MVGHRSVLGHGDYEQSSPERHSRDAQKPRRADRGTARLLQRMAESASRMRENGVNK